MTSPAKWILIPIAFATAACTSQVKPADAGSTAGAGASGTSEVTSNQSGTGGVGMSGVGGAGMSVGTSGMGGSTACASDAITTPPEGAVFLAVDSDYIYWTGAIDDGSVWRAPKAGGSATLLSKSPTALNGSAGLAVDETMVFWSNHDGGIYSAPKTGGPPNVILPVMDSGDSADFAIDDVSLYAINGPATRIVKVPKAGGEPVVLATAQQATAIAIDSANVYWIDGPLYWIPKAGGSVGTFPSDVGDVKLIAADDSGVYGADYACNIVKLAAGGAKQVLAETSLSAGCTTQFAMDATRIYWSASSVDMGFSSTVYSVAKTGGNPVPLLTCPRFTGGEGGIVADSTSLFWPANNNPNTILRLPKN